MKKEKDINEKLDKIIELLEKGKTPQDNWDALPKNEAEVTVEGNKWSQEKSSHTNDNEDFESAGKEIPKIPG